ncbi:Maf family protein [Candidatus Uhrbacteria bacterium]|nr:Maf family protein [Candidatus Uhrbacteria bacterium]
MTIILGSASKGRKRILEERGFTFDAMSADIDEKAIRDPDPEKLVLLLAHAKADALIPRIKEPAFLITSDQVVLCNGEILEKPENEDEERAMLQMYTTHPAETVAAVVVTNTETGERAGGVDRGKVWFHTFPHEAIKQIVVYPRTYELAGGFSIIDPLFMPYIDHIEGERESIIGLPWALTQRLLEEVRE